MQKSGKRKRKEKKEKTAQKVGNTKCGKITN